jgi:Lipocalin-like domain
MPTCRLVRQLWCCGDLTRPPLGAVQTASVRGLIRSSRNGATSRRASAVAALSIFGCAVGFSLGVAQAQSVKDVAGIYTAVAVTNVLGERTTEPYGPNPKGVMVLDANGRYVVVLMRPGLPKFASNNRSTGTAEEYKAIALGSFTHFGTYTVADGHIIFRLENTTFPNWDGQEQKRALTVSGDELRYTLVSTMGGTPTVAWKRAK